MRQHVYRAFGLTVRANGPIPGLSLRQGDLDADSVPLEIDLGCAEVAAALDRERFFEDTARAQASLVHETATDDTGQFLRVWSSPDATSYWFIYSDGAAFLIESRGSRILARWPRTLTLEDAAVYLLGPVLGFALRLRGIVCLHASAVAAAGGCLVLVAPSGHGKSTTAAAFALRGRSILTDDIVALVERRGRFWVMPGYPRVRLWTDSTEALFGSGDALPRISPDNDGWDKRYVDLTAEGFRFASQARPLTAIYTGERDETAIEPSLQTLSRGDALMRLVGNAYSRHLVDATTRAAEFDILSRLVGQVPVRLFRVRKGFEHLGDLCDLLHGDCLATEPSTKEPSTKEPSTKVGTGAPTPATVGGG